MVFVVTRMAYFDTLMMNRTIKVVKIILLRSIIKILSTQQLILHKEFELLRFCSYCNNSKFDHQNFYHNFYLSFDRPIHYQL